MKKEELILKRLDVLNDKLDRSDDTNILEAPWVKRLLELKEISELDRSIVVEMIDHIAVFNSGKIKITYNFSNELGLLFKNEYCDQKIG